MIRTLIVADRNLLVKSLKSTLEQDDQITVIGCVGDGLAAVKLCNTLLPDLVLINIRLPGCNGIEGARLVKSAHSWIKVLIVTKLEDERNIQAALESGVDGYLLNDISPKQLIQAIKNVHGGFEVISAKAFKKVYPQLRSKPELTPEKAVVSSLREIEITLIRLVAEGNNNKQIAANLFLSEGRIKNILTNLLKKLNLKNRYELLSFAYKNRLID